MTRRQPGRATRQILSGTQLTPPREPQEGQSGRPDPASITFRYLVALSGIVIIAALVWAIWGMGPASPLILVLAIGLVASWLVL